MRARISPDSLVFALLIFPGSRPPSIVSADELNFCVRDGNRWTLIAINTNLFGWVLPIIYVKTLVQVLTVFVFSSFLPKLKAQRSGFQFEATNQHTGEETRLRVFEHCVLREELVTRTGFEPMLKA